MDVSEEPLWRTSTLFDDLVSLLLVQLSGSRRSEGIQAEGTLLAKQVPVGGADPEQQPQQEDQQPHHGDQERLLLLLVSSGLSSRLAPRVASYSGPRGQRSEGVLLPPLMRSSKDNAGIRRRWTAQIFMEAPCGS